VIAGGQGGWRDSLRRKPGDRARGGARAALRARLGVLAVLYPRSNRLPARYANLTRGSSIRVVGRWVSNTELREHPFRRRSLGTALPDRQGAQRPSMGGVERAARTQAHRAAARGGLERPATRGVAAAIRRRRWRRLSAATPARRRPSMRCTTGCSICRPTTLDNWARSADRRTSNYRPVLRM